MSLDILAALSGTAVPSGGRCKIQRWLDSIDPDAPGLPELIAAVNTNRAEDGPQPKEYRPLQATLTLLSQLGLSVGVSLLHEHRKQTCRCYR